MITFTTVIQQFEERGDKTGWTYIVVSPSIAQQIKPGDRRSFRVKGFLDDYAFEGVNLMPLGEGKYIMALNAAVRKAIRKKKGAKVRVRMEEDHKPFQPPPGFMESLEDEPEALSFFQSLTQSHRNYFMKWVAGAKTDQTRIRRMALAVTALFKKQDYGTMLRSNRRDKDEI